jgi:hypothetical protein
VTPLPLAIGKFSGQLQGAGSYSNPALGQQGGCSHEAVLVVLVALGHSARTHKRGQVPKCQMRGLYSESDKSDETPIARNLNQSS